MGMSAIEQNHLLSQHEHNTYQKIFRAVLGIALRTIGLILIELWMETK